MSRTIVAVNLTSGAVLGDKIRLADTALTRLIGLLGKSRLEAGGGLLLLPASGIHTVGMLFPIDVLALDRQRRVLRIWEQLPPGRFAGLSRKTSCILELPPGTASGTGVAVGDEIDLRLADS